MGLLAKEKNPTARKKDWLELQAVSYTHLEYFACEIYYIPTGASSYQSSGVSSVEIGAYRLEQERQRRQERALVNMINSLIPDGAIDFE